MIIGVERATDAAEVRRRAADLAQRLAFDAERAGRVSIVATELATNLVKHAGRGEIVVQPYAADARGDGIELIAIDSGPGIADLARAYQDGYSTAGSPGTGLGAVRRIADTVNLFSRPGQGTIALARLAPARARDGAGAGFEIGAVLGCAPGEADCGDAWAVLPRGAHGCRLVMVDGSGHGRLAAEAAGAAVALFQAKPGLPLVELVETLHRGIAHTRGAAIGIAEIERSTVRFVGLGNIAGVVIDGERRRGMVSTGGTLGHTWHAVKEFNYPVSGGATVILHSDGVGTRWHLDTYPGLAACHPGVIAAMLYRDFRRGRDDAGIAVVKVNP